jgi:Predicted membrane protein (DUF2157)
LAVKQPILPRMHDLLHRLVAQYSLSNDKAARLWQISRVHDKPVNVGPNTERGLGMVAALLLGAGLIFWVAANWQDQSRQFKFYLIQGVLLASVVGALVWPRGRNAMLLLATLALGGLLAFIGQTYQTGADPWQLFVVWAALALLWVVAARSDGLWAMWVLIVGTGIALWSGDHLLNPIANIDRMFWGSKYRSYLTPLLWALLVLVTALVTRLSLRAPSGEVTGRYALRLAVFLALGAWCTYGLWDLFRRQPTIYMFNTLLVVGTAAIAWFNKPRDITLVAMVVLALDAMFLGLVVRMLFNDRGSSEPIGQMLIFGVTAAATVGFSGQWIYKLQKQEGAA